MAELGVSPCKAFMPTQAGSVHLLIDPQRLTGRPQGWSQALIRVHYLRGHILWT